VVCGGDAASHMVVIYLSEPVLCGQNPDVEEWYALRCHADLHRISHLGLITFGSVVRALFLD